MKKSKRRRSVEQVAAALRKSRRTYEKSGKGKARKSAWVERNRDEVNAYKRAWRARRREKKLRDVVGLAQF